MVDLLVPRTPWPAGFPDVVIHARLDERNNHPDFPGAKSGDRDAAVRLALALSSTGAWDQLFDLASEHPILLPVTAVEVEGFNAIPDAVARVAGSTLGWEVSAGSVIQSNRVGHTRAKGWHRLVTPALFEGAVEAGRNYVLVDDHVGFGGTLANLRGFVEAGGGRVIGMTTLTETRDARTIAVRPDVLSMLESRHGQTLEDFWQITFGHGLDCLTNVEAGYLARQLSADDIRARMAEAAEQARGRGLRPVEIDVGG